MQQINIQYYNSPCGELILASVGDTVTSVLVPWTACGMTQSTVLGIPTLVYLPLLLPQHHQSINELSSSYSGLDS